MYLKLMRIACGALCAALVACTGDTPDKLVESGRRYLDGNDPGAAVIQLKNALQKDPNSAEARFLLGKALLDSNDAVAAAVELRKALDLKHPEEVVLPVLARAMLAQGDSQKLIERYAATDLPTPAAAADLKTSIAIALILQGKLPQAQTALAAALAAQPEHVPALIVQARVHAGHRDLKSAFAALDKILAHKPVGADALQLKADLLRQKGDSAGALQAYREALPLARDQLAPRAGILSVLMAENDLQAARKELDDLRKELPHHPQVAYFEAELAFRKGDHKAAKEIAQQLLKVLPDNTRVLQLAGALELQERSYLRAQQMLTRALNLSPDLAGARFALAQAYLGTGDPAKVLSTLGPLLDNNPTAPVLRLAASAYMLKGELAKADELFSRVLETRPGDVRARTAMALTDLRQGDANVAFSELESIAAADTGSTADLALIGSHLGRREYDKALAAIDALERKPHGKVLGPYLRGRTYFVRGDLRQARQGLDKALAADPAFLPAVEAMAAIDVAEKKPDAAEKRFRKLLEKQPDNARALQALARLRETGGAKKDEVVDLLTRAARVSQGDPAPRLALVDYQMRQREPKQAVTVAQDAVAAFPESAEAQEALGRALLAAGDTHQAIGAFNRMANQRPQSPVPWLWLAEAHTVLKDKEAAVQSARRALAQAPNDMEVQRKTVEYELATGRVKEALAIARAAQVQRQGSAFGHSLEGDIHASGKQWDTAAKAYKAALDRQQATVVAEKLHLALLSAGKRAEADAMAADWVGRHANDAHFLFFLANLSLSRQDLPAAEERLAQVVKVNPENAAAHNLLAWVMLNLKKPRAAEHAALANKLRPNDPAFMDVWASSLAMEGKVRDAIEIQKKSVDLQPANALLRLNLAKLYAQGGDKAMARKELQTLAQLGDKFPMQNEVKRLQESL